MTKSLNNARIIRGMAAQSAARWRCVGDGARLIGWKVGFGAPAALEKFQLEGPLVGYLLDSGVLASGSRVPVSSWVKPVAEPEIYVEMGADLRGGASRMEVAFAISSMGPAIELADLTFTPDDVERILSNNIFQRHVILGHCDTARHGARLDGLSGVVMRNNVPHATVTDLEVNTGEIVGIVRHVADLLADLGDGLRAGEIIICGSVVPPIFVESGDESVAFDLKPIGSVSVRFT